MCSLPGGANSRHTQPGWVEGHVTCWSISGFLYLCDCADGFGAPLPEHQFVLTVQVLWSLDETEVDGGLVACPQAVLVHAEDGRRLPDAAAVDWRRETVWAERQRRHNLTLTSWRNQVPLTHRLVSQRYCSRVVEHQDLSLKFPGGLWHQLGREHHHAFPYRRALDLRREMNECNQLLSCIDLLRPTFFRANEAVWPPWTSLTDILLRWMDFTGMGMKVPSGSGPSSSVSLSRITPRNVVPDTTVPTPWRKESRGQRFSLGPSAVL